MVFLWRVQFGQTACKAPQLQQLSSSMGRTANRRRRLPCANLVRPLDSIMPAQLDDGRRIFASVGSNADAAKRHLAARRTHYDRRSGERVGASGARPYRHAQGARRARHTDPEGAEDGSGSDRMNPDHIERDISEGANITPRRSEPGKAQPKRGPLPDHPPALNRSSTSTAPPAAIVVAPCTASARASARCSTMFRPL